MSIIPCWNQLEFTRQCVRALVRHTHSPLELIVVSNGSTDGTGDYMAGLQDASPVPVTVIANSIDRGFPAAINQGLREARGEYLAPMNNDVVVTDAWLEQLVALTQVRVAGTGTETFGPGSGGVVRPLLSTSWSRITRWADTA
jgi:glycosyltransferase involved in cell wall biosynthesis